MCGVIHTHADCGCLVVTQVRAWNKIQLHTTPIIRGEVGASRSRVDAECTDLCDGIHKHTLHKKDELSQQQN